VEIVRDVGISTGTIMGKVEGEKDNWWLVTFGADCEDEEISENAFGRLIKSGSAKGGRSTRRATRRNHGTSSSLENTFRSDADDDLRNNSNNPTDDIKNGTGIEPDRSTSTCNRKKTKMKTKAKTNTKKKPGEDACIYTRSSSKRKKSSNVLSLDSTPSRKTGGNKRQRRKQGEEEVEKVKLLTGTLYLYRGENARVEFRRKY